MHKFISESRIIENAITKVLNNNDISNVCNLFTYYLYDIICNIKLQSLYISMNVTDKMIRDTIIYHYDNNVFDSNEIFRANKLYIKQLWKEEKCFMQVDVEFRHRKSYKQCLTLDEKHLLVEKLEEKKSIFKLHNIPIELLQLGIYNINRRKYCNISIKCYK